MFVWLLDWLSVANYPSYYVDNGQPECQVSCVHQADRVTLQTPILPIQAFAKQILSDNERSSSWLPFKRDARAAGGGRGKCSLMDGADRLLRNAPPGPTVTHQCQCRSPVWGLKLRRALCQKIYNFDGGATVIVWKLRRTIKNS